MKKITLLGFGFLLLIAPNLFAQEIICDDFTEAPWPTDEGFEAGDLVGYSQDDTQPITVGADGDCSFGPWNEGIYYWNTLNFAFDGSNQSAQFEIYGFAGQYDQMGFTVNGSAIHYMDETFPMTIEGVTIDLDESAVDFDDWDNAYLIFTGEIEEVDLIGFESGLLSLCVESLFEEEDCEDFTNLDEWPVTWYTGADVVTDEIIGTTQGGAYDVTMGSDGGAIHINSDDPYVGIFGWETRINFAFSGENQSARFKIYYWSGSEETASFSVNGSADVFLDDSFPLIIDGVAVDFDTSLPDPDIPDMHCAYLIFTGDLTEVSHYIYETGILELCVEPAFEESDCDNFFNAEEWNWDGNYEEDDLLGYTQSGAYPVTCTDGHGWINDSGDETGILIGEGAVEFEFSGANQEARFTIYHNGLDEYFGFSINDGTAHYLNESFPLTVDGVTVDLDTSPDDPGMDDDIWGELSYLTFTGELTSVELDAIESGVTELCVEPYFAFDGECDDFTNDPWPIGDFFPGEVVGYTQGGEFPVTVGDEGVLNVNNTPGLPGILVNNSSVHFEFDGSDQFARFEIYDWFGGEYNGFRLNGEPKELLDATFPMTVDGVLIDLEIHDTYIGAANEATLTFDGEFDHIEFIGGELGITQLCYEADSTEIDDTGLETLNNSHITIYPNPARNYVQVENTETIERISIYSISGQEMIAQAIGKSSAQLDLSDLVPGIYLIKITEQNGTETIEKLIRE